MAALCDPFDQTSPHLGGGRGGGDAADVEAERLRPGFEIDGEEIGIQERSFGSGVIVAAAAAIVPGILRRILILIHILKDILRVRSGGSRVRRARARRPCAARSRTS